jgi:hypothetical protein
MQQAPQVSQLFTNTTDSSAILYTYNGYYYYISTKENIESLPAEQIEYLNNTIIYNNTTYTPTDKVHLSKTTLQTIDQYHRLANYLQQNSEKYKPLTLADICNSDFFETYDEQVEEYTALESNVEALRIASLRNIYSDYKRNS